MSERPPHTLEGRGLLKIQQPPPHTLEGNALWGAKAIAAFLACSTDKVHTLKETDAPISKVGGQLFALRTDLLEWLRQQAA